MVCALRTKRTVLAICAAIYLCRLLAFLVVPDKRQFLPLRAGKLVLCFVVRESVYVIHRIFVRTALRIIQLSRSLRIRNYAIGLTLGCFQNGIIAKFPSRLNSVRCSKSMDWNGMNDMCGTKAQPLRG